MNAVLSHPDNDISPTDPEQAGGEGFDLADLGLAEAWFIRITDAGTNPYEGSSGGFDLDAAFSAVVSTRCIAYACGAYGRGVRLGDG